LSWYKRLTMQKRLVSGYKV